MNLLKTNLVLVRPKKVKVPTRTRWTTWTYANPWLAAARRKNIILLFNPPQCRRLHNHAQNNNSIYMDVKFKRQWVMPPFIARIVNEPDQIVFFIQNIFQGYILTHIAYYWTKILKVLCTIYESTQWITFVQLLQKCHEINHLLFTWIHYLVLCFNLDSLPQGPYENYVGHRVLTYAPKHIRGFIIDKPGSPALPVAGDH